MGVFAKWFMIGAVPKRRLTADLPRSARLDVTLVQYGRRTKARKVSRALGLDLVADWCCQCGGLLPEGRRAKAQDGAEVPGTEDGE
jgi:hypothetical protein